MYRQSPIKQSPIKPNVSPMCALRSILVAKVNVIVHQMKNIELRIKNLPVSDDLSQKISALQEIVSFDAVEKVSCVPGAQQTLEIYQDFEQNLEEPMRLFGEIYESVNGAITILELAQKDVPKSAESTSHEVLQEEEVEVEDEKASEATEATECASAPQEISHEIEAQYVPESDQCFYGFAPGSFLTFEPLIPPSLLIALHELSEVLNTLPTLESNLPTSVPEDTDPTTSLLGYSEMI